MRAKKLSHKQLVKKADDLARDHCRGRGHCEMKELRPELKCKGPLQWCHIVRRRFYSTRWDDDNALCGCAAHHTYFTNNPEPWVLALEARWPGRYQALWDRAQVQWRWTSMDEVLERLSSSTTT